MIDLKILENGVFAYRNVVGYSMTPKPKLSNGVLTGEEAIRIYVTEKLPLSILRTNEIFPQSIEGMSTDIIAIGYPRIRPPTPLPQAVNDGRRKVVRPLVSGISVGNWAITAGTLGNPAEYTDKNIYMMSNAHVFSDDPSKEVSGEKRIIQPGKYDKGTLDNLIGEYFWHDQIYPTGGGSDCQVSKDIVWGLNKLSSYFDKKTRFKTFLAVENHQDLAAMKLREDIDYEIKTYDFDVINKYGLAGRIFAGSEQVSIVCKVKYQLGAGFKPLDVDTILDVAIGTVGRKSGRTTFDTTGTTIDEGAVVNVNYGNFTARQGDVVLTEPMCSGGDSGSDWWVELP